MTSAVLRMRPASSASACARVALARRSAMAGTSPQQTQRRLYSSPRRLAALSSRSAISAIPAISTSTLPQTQLRFYSPRPPPRHRVEKNKDTDEEENENEDEEEEPLPPLREGFVRLTEQELEEVRRVLSMAPMTTPAEVAEAVMLLGQIGAPVELRELLIKKQTQGLSLMDGVKMTRACFSLSRAAAEFDLGRDQAKRPRETEDTNKSDSPFSQNEAPEHGRTDKEKEKTEKEKNDKNEKNDKKGPPKLDGGDWLSWVIGAAVFYPVYAILFSGGRETEISWQELRRNFLDRGLVEKLVVTGKTVYVQLNREATQAAFPDQMGGGASQQYYFTIGSDAVFEHHLDAAQNELGIPSTERIPVQYTSESGLGQLLVGLAPALVSVGLIVWLSRRMGGGGGGSGGIFGYGKSKARRFNHESDVKVKFSDVAGMDEAKMEIMEFVSFLKQPDRFQRLGAKIPRGAVLAGPPGTGKTLLAKATAGESGVPFFSVSGSEFVEMFVGVGASRVRDLFATARKSAPCIIFIDEIDAIGKSRSDGKFGGGGNDEREATLNQILTEMDGFNTSDQVVVLAGTNRPEILDKALMRPGRFDRHIQIDPPTMAGRQDIFRVYLRKIVTEEDVEFLVGRLGALTPGFAGADIANAVNEAALVAARENAATVELRHFEQAIERVVGGLERKSLVLNPTEKRTVAYHEAGHAVCGWYFEHADPLLKVSIIPRGKGLGYAQYLPAGDTFLMNEKQLRDRMAMALGGRISEELHFDTVTSGASDDFNKVTQMARTMVTEWGMSKKVGPIRFRQESNEWVKPFAEATAQLIDAEVRAIVDAAYAQCKTLLQARATEVGLVAEELLRKEVLSRDDMVRLLGPRPFADNEDFTKYFNNDHVPPAKTTPTPTPTPTPTSTSDDNVDTLPDGPAAPALFHKL